LPTFEDATRKKESAVESMKRQGWAEAIFHAQECIDLSVKAFLQALEIKYEPKHGLGENISQMRLNG
jgi:HEPN domain-containing protein